MWLVLCGINDLPALWAYQGLKARGLQPLELVTSELLACSLCWEHRVGVEDTSTEITLADGRIIRNDQTWGVLNRLCYIPSQHLQAANPKDRDYAMQELMAFFMSWLNSFPAPVLNPATPQGLSGQWRHISEWVKLSGSAGLPTPTYRQTSHDALAAIESERRLFPPGTPVRTVIVVGGDVVGAAVPLEIARGCQRLAQLAQTPLLGIEFADSSFTPWMFAGATPFPDLRLGGLGLLDRLTQILQGKETV